MPMYEVDFSYKLPEWGSVTLEANDVDEAEQLGREYVTDSYQDIEDVEIESVRELKRDGK